MVMDPGREAEERGIVINVENVSKSFRDVPVLENISLKINSGDIFGIIGPSGAGKTTLLNLMIGFLAPDEGDIKANINKSIDNTNVNADNIGRNFCSVYDNINSTKRQWGFSAQAPSFYSGLTVRENLIYFGTLYDIPDDRLAVNIENALALVGLKKQEHVDAEELSGGMQKRLDIACALIHSPRVLLMDEPTADLDITLRKQIWNVIKRINEKGTTVIIATHSLDDVEELCSRIAVLYNRRIIEQGGINEIKKHYNANQEVHLELAKGDYKKIMDALKSQHKYPITKLLLENNKLVVYSQHAEKILHYIVHIVEKLGYSIEDVYLNNPSLDEVFESLVESTEKKAERKR